MNLEQKNHNESGNNNLVLQGDHAGMEFLLNMCKFAKCVNVLLTMKVQKGMKN